MKHLKHCYSPLDGMLVHYRVTAQQYVAGAVVPFVNGRCHFLRQKGFDLLWTVFLYQRERKSQPKVKPGPQTRTICILISLPYHYTTTPIRQNAEKFKYCLVFIYCSINP